MVENTESMKYINRIRSGMKSSLTISTGRVTTRILDGSYSSIYKGRSLNFDELREYVPGDEVRDIDWKASSRSRRLLVKQFVAEKKHNIMLVFDTNKRMTAFANESDTKSLVGLLSAGTLGFLVSRNGDYVGATYACKGGVRYFPFKTGLMNLERILESYDKDSRVENDTELDEALDYIIRNFRQKMILVLVTDAEGVLKVSDANLRRLLVMHDVLVLQMRNADTYGQRVYDMEEGIYLPDFITKDKRLTRHERKRKKALEAQCEDRLESFGIATSVFSDTAGLDNQILALLNKHKAKKR